MARPLPEGLYEEIVTRDLEEALERVGKGRYEAQAVEMVEAGRLLGRHLAAEVERAFRAVEKRRRPPRRPRSSTDSDAAR